MYVIGLTGGIGSGKSTVAKLFAEKGINIIDTDELAREVIDECTLQQLVDRFGETILLPDKKLNRAKLRAIVFHENEQRIWLEKLLHPLILKKMKQKIESVTSPYCIVVIPLLFETDPNPILQRVLVVDATEKQQIERAKIRDNLTKEEIEKVMRTQVSRQHRLALANDIVENHGDLTNLKKQVAKLHECYVTLSSINNNNKSNEK